MALRITDPSHVPFGGAFVYRHPDTGAEFRHHTVPHLFEMARKHAQANGLAFNQDDFIKNVCSNTPGGICHETDEHGNPSWYQMAVSAADALGDTVMRAATLRQITADKDIIQMRQGICESCPEWTGVLGGTLLSGGCKLCGCSGIKLALPGQKCPKGLW